VRKKVITLFLVLIVVCAVIVGAIYLYYELNSPQDNIKANTKYYLREIACGILFDDAGTQINLATNENSYIEFDDKTQTVKLFITQIGSRRATTISFIVTETKVLKKTITRTLERVYGGDIVSLSLQATETEIKIFGDVSYKVKNGPEAQVGNPIKTEMLSLLFSIEPPAYPTIPPIYYAPSDGGQTNE
jgi:hypothetical protein